MTPNELRAYYDYQQNQVLIDFGKELCAWFDQCKYDGDIQLTPAQYKAVVAFIDSTAQYGGYWHTDYKWKGHKLISVCQKTSRSLTLEMRQMAFLQTR